MKIPLNKDLTVLGTDKQHEIKNSEGRIYDIAVYSTEKALISPFLSTL